MTATFTRILFATDLSINSTCALKRASELASATGARLHLLHVTEPISDDARITIQMFVQSEQARLEALGTRTEYARAILDERLKVFWESIPEDAERIRAQIHSTDVIEGHPAEVILRRGKELACDLIVLGAHNHGFTQTFLGSVAKRVLRRARIPTLVVPYVAEG